MRPNRRIGLIGFGSIAERGHLPAWRRLGVEVAAVADLASLRLDRAGHLLPEATFFDSPMELIERGDIDVVDICTPPATHVDFILAACRQHLPDIVCEKPLVLSEDEYVRIAGARRESGSRVISVNNWVHSDLNRCVTTAIRRGEVGGVQSVELKTGRPDCALGDDGWLPRWRTDSSYSGGGIILDHGWHQLYLLLGWMQAPLERISAVTRTVDTRHHPVEDEALIDVLFSTSGRGRIELSWTADERTNEGRIRGEDGMITALDDRIVVENRQGRKDVLFDSKLTESSYHPDWFAQVFRYNVLDDKSSEAERNFNEAGVLVSAVQAAYRSAQKGGLPEQPILTGWMRVGN